MKHDTRWFKVEDMIPCKWHDYPDEAMVVTGHSGWSAPCPSCTAFERGRQFGYDDTLRQLRLARKALT